MAGAAVLVIFEPMLAFELVLRMLSLVPQGLRSYAQYLVTSPQAAPPGQFTPAFAGHELHLPNPPYHLAPIHMEICTVQLSCINTAAIFLSAGEGGAAAMVIAAIRSFLKMQTAHGC